MPGEPTGQPVCAICGGPTTALAEKPSTFSGRTYHLRQCPRCWFSFVANPWTDMDAIYSSAYYEGRGADPSVDYAFELAHPDETIRHYEWRGILRLVRTLIGVTSATRWLDYGCGHGGLVRYLREQGVGAAFGYDTGAMAETARTGGVPVLTTEALSGSAPFDVVTLSEVIEHVADPMALLRGIRRLLAPGGLLLLTTGNAAPYRHRLAAWRYVLPDVHVSFFEPDTLVRALEQSGFRPERPGFGPGFADVIRFKVLKAVGARRRAAWERALPWSVLARVVDARLGVSAHPVGWAR